MRTYPIEMDLESNRSANTNDALLPPPPPAPRTPPTTNLMTALPVGLSAAVAPSASILPTPPPPPPLVMLHPAAAPQVLVDRSTTGSACASAVFPYFPPPPPQLTVGQGAKTMVAPQTAATPIMFTGVPYTTNLGATPSLAVPAVPAINLTSQAASAAPRAPGICLLECFCFGLQVHLSLLLFASFQMSESMVKVLLRLFKLLLMFEHWDILGI